MSRRKPHDVKFKFKVIECMNNMQLQYIMYIYKKWPIDNISLYVNRGARELEC